jgi:cell division protein ZapA
LAHVTVKINGYAYTVGCEDGQEQHLLAMAQQVESRIESIKTLGGNTGEARLLVLAALLMADEIHDMRIELEGLRAAAAASAKTPRAKGEGKADPEVTRKLGRLTVRAEEIAASMERP